MGAGSSKRTVDAVLNMISEVCVNTMSTCLAHAENRVLIEAAGMQNVVMRNVTIDSVADASVNCTNNTIVEAGTLNNNIEKHMNDMIESANNIEGGGPAQIKLVNDIQKAVTKDVVSQCITDAINEFEIKFDEIGGDFIMQNYDITQVANAHMSKCLNSNDVRVGDVPLRKYLEQELPNFKIKESALAGTQQCRLKSKKPLGYAIMGGAAVLVILLIVVYMFATRE